MVLYRINQGLWLLKTDPNCSALCLKRETILQKKGIYILCAMASCKYHRTGNLLSALKACPLHLIARSYQACHPG